MSDRLPALAQQLDRIGDQSALDHVLVAGYLGQGHAAWRPVVWRPAAPGGRRQARTGVHAYEKRALWITRDYGEVVRQLPSVSVGGNCWLIGSGFRSPPGTRDPGRHTA